MIKQIGNLMPDTAKFKNRSAYRVYAIDGLAPTITTSGGGGRVPIVMLHDMKLRKLTPRECLRLMDVDEQNIDTMLNAGLSDTQLYKLAGNSIVVSCMCHIFRKLFIDTQPIFFEADNKNALN